MPYWGGCGVKGTDQAGRQDRHQVQITQGSGDNGVATPFRLAECAVLRHGLVHIPVCGPVTASHCSARRSRHAGNSRRIAAREQPKSPRGVSADRRPGRLHIVNAIEIKVFTRRGLGPEILDDGPEGYLGKRGVPTSGGAAIIVAMWRATVVAMRKCLSGRLHAPL